jgi:conjugative relaxase-like TrwC/TraI family protein
MLSISAIASASAAVAYVEREALLNYYDEAGVALKRWFGKGAEFFSLSGPVDPKALHNLLDGRSPDGKTPLVQNAGHAKRRPGWDLTFNDCKDLSTLWAVSPPDLRKRIDCCRAKAAEVALTLTEEMFGFTRRGQGGKTLERAAMAFAIYEHRISRAAEPHLHIHAISPNVAVRADGSTGALWTHELYLAKIFLGTLYRVQAAAELRADLELQLHAATIGFRIEGVPATLSLAWSTRGQQIRALLAERGQSGAIAARVAAEDSRGKKPDIPLHRLSEIWRQCAQEHGFTPERATQLLGLGRQFRASPENLERELSDAWNKCRPGRRKEFLFIRAAGRLAIECGANAAELQSALDHFRATNSEAPLKGLGNQKAQRYEQTKRSRAKGSVHASPEEEKEPTKSSQAKNIQEVIQSAKETEVTPLKANFPRESEKDAKNIQAQPLELEGDKRGDDKALANEAQAEQDRMGERDHRTSQREPPRAEKACSASTLSPLTEANTNSHEGTLDRSEQARPDAPILGAAKAQVLSPSQSELNQEEVLRSAKPRIDKIQRESPERSRTSAKDQAEPLKEKGAPRTTPSTASDMGHEEDREHLGHKSRSTSDKYDRSARTSDKDRAPKHEKKPKQKTSQKTRRTKTQARGSNRPPKPLNDKAVNKSFWKEFVERVEDLHPELQTTQRLHRIAFELMVKHSAEPRFVDQALNKILPLAEAPVLHVESTRLFPDAWPFIRDMRMPKLALGIPQMKWGKIIWKQNLLIGEFRVQEKRLFPNAPQWSPLHKLELPHLRFTTKHSYTPPKEEQTPGKKNTENSKTQDKEPSMERGR